ncbi:MAG: ribosome-binding factor A [Mariprofundaceae bacterium]|nr:ribosome-binding factor A [Mariprofundaceae bacterium]
MKASKTPTQQRFQADMHRLLTTILQRDVEDPMLLGLSLTRFEMTDQQGQAIAYVHSMLPIEEKECVARLNRLKPHLLHILRKAMPKKRMPALLFRWDDALDKTHQVMDTMDALHPESLKRT